MGRMSKPVKRAFTLTGMLIAMVVRAQPDRTPVTFMHAMHTSMKRMNHDMAAAPMNGNADHDFAAMMMPHHEGAIEMAKVELIYGKDPAMRRLAQEILVDQQSEIDVMQLWLAKGRDSKTKKER